MLIIASALWLILFSGNLCAQETSGPTGETPAAPEAATITDTGKDTGNAAGTPQSDKTLMAPAETAADGDKRKPASKKGPDKISLESDKAVISRSGRVIELEGNVRIRQGGTVITSDYLKLFLKEGASIESPGTAGESAIEKVIADGNVEFKLDIGTAYSDHAEYITETKSLILTGKEPKFISEKNTITGSKITVNRDSGTVTFEGGASAEIYSNEKL